MNKLFSSIWRPRIVALLIACGLGTGLMIFIFPVMALSSVHSHSFTNSSSGENSLCHAQIASNPTITYTTADAGAVRTAVNLANSDDVIKIAGHCKGVITQAGNPQVVYIDKNLALQGGYTPPNWITPSLEHPAVLDAEFAGRVIVVSSNYSVTMTNLQITQGNATGLAGGPFGGFDAGGGIYIPSMAAVSLNYVEVVSNTGSLGGGIYNWGGTLLLQNSDISGNFGRSDNSNLGGGLFNYNSGQITIKNSLFQSNTLPNTFGSGHGGAIYNSGYITIEHTTFQYNSTNLEEGDGGAINNQANGTILINASTLAHNESVFGGAITNFATMIITNSTISQNSAPGGGAGINNGGWLSLQNSSVLSNTTPAIFGGQGIYSGFGGETYLTNSIIGYNAGADCLRVGTIVSNGYNLDSDGTCFQSGVNNDISSPNLGVSSLADNGGATQTHALLTGSPAVETGNCSNGAVIVDQRGVPRPQANACDRGAFEVRPFSNLTVVSDAVEVTLLGTAVAFTATVQGGDSVTFAWDFGDGRAGSGASVSHTYLMPGTYSVTVTARNPIQVATASLSVEIIAITYLPLIIKPEPQAEQFSSSSADGGL